jgi:hypothetical protein
MRSLAQVLSDVLLPKPVEHCRGGLTIQEHEALVELTGRCPDCFIHDTVAEEAAKSDD